MARAQKFLDGARDLLDLHGEGDHVDNRITLLVHAGIAASDVVCCARTGYHPQGADHAEAIGALKAADAGSEKHLARLLRLKTASGYGSTVTSAADAAAALRAAEALVARAAELA